MRERYTVYISVSYFCALLAPMRQHIFLDIWWIAIFSVGIFTPDISKNIHLWLSLMKRCRKILLAHDTSWIYARVYESENDGRMKNMRASTGKIICLSILSWRCKLNPVERDVNSRVNSFISRGELGVCVRSGAKVIPFSAPRFSAAIETWKLGCWHDNVDSLLRSQATSGHGNCIFRHGSSIYLRLSA